jgi:hypothetical protein
MSVILRKCRSGVDNAMMRARRIPSSGIQRHSPWKSTDVSEEHVASIFKIKELVKWETSVIALGTKIQVEVTCSSETSIDSEQGTRSDIPEDRTLYNHRYQNLESYRVLKKFNENLSAGIKMDVRCEPMCGNGVINQNFAVLFKHSASSFMYFLFHAISKYPSSMDVWGGFRISVRWNPLRYAGMYLFLLY